jgi:hypothetical protein
MGDRFKPESMNGMGQNMHKKGETNQETYELTRDMILSVLLTDPELRHRRQLLQDFIGIELPTLTTDSEIEVMRACQSNDPSIALCVSVVVA